MSLILFLAACSALAATAVFLSALAIAAMGLTEPFSLNLFGYERLIGRATGPQVLVPTSSPSPEILVASSDVAFGVRGTATSRLTSQGVQVELMNARNVISWLTQGDLAVVTRSSQAGVYQSVRENA